MKARWETADGGYSNTKYLILGAKWRVGGVSYDGVTRGGEKYYWFCRLPGIKERSEKRYKTAEEAQAYLEKIVAYWVKEAGLTEAE